MKKTRQIKKQPLSPQAELFCSFYTAIGSPTFSRKEASAVAAGYSEKSARNRAWGLLMNPDVKRRISELHAANLSKNGITTDSVLRDVLHDRDCARERNDFATAARLDEMLGKFLSMWTDCKIIVDDMRPQIDEALLRRAKEVASVIIHDDLLPEPVKELPQPEQALTAPGWNVTDSILVDDESGAEGEGDE